MKFAVILYILITLILGNAYAVPILMDDVVSGRRTWTGATLRSLRDVRYAHTRQHLDAVLFGKVRYGP
ncbi:hypothetical protein K474DRAFT_1712084 [Panus rudis PR-1116 ss-1]|nr:hypothetical protein K474DRAFT_1712084 [Panus rudis PR-1116 ss-1]